MTDAIDAPVRGWRALPTWARVGLLVLAAVLVALVATVLVRLATRVPPIPLGVTAVDDLRTGSCLAEGDRGLSEYTVVACGVEHPQQVFATAELELDEFVYASVESALATFGDEVCDHYLEYRLFLLEGLEKSGYTAYAIAVPDPATYRAGDTEALCAIAPESGGTMTGDLYRPMP